MQLEPSLRLTGPENRQPSAGTPESRPTLCSGCRALRLSECLVPQKSWFQGAALLVRPPNANEATGHSSRASVAARRGKVGPELRGNVVLLSGPPRQGLREKEPAKKMPEERATGFARPAGALAVSGSARELLKKLAIQAGRLGGGLGGPPPRPKPNGHHSPQRSHGLITTLCGLTGRLAPVSRIGATPIPQGQLPRHSKDMGHLPAGNCPQGRGPGPASCLLSRGRRVGPGAGGASLWPDGAACSSRAQLPAARFGSAAPTTSSGHRAGWQPGGTHRPMAQPRPRAERPLPGGGPLRGT